MCILVLSCGAAECPTHAADYCSRIKEILYGSKDDRSIPGFDECHSIGAQGIGLQCTRLAATPTERDAIIADLDMMTQKCLDQPLRIPRHSNTIAFYADDKVIELSGGGLYSFSTPKRSVFVAVEIVDAAAHSKLQDVFVHHSKLSMKLDRSAEEEFLYKDLSTRLIKWAEQLYGPQNSKLAEFEAQLASVATMESNWKNAVMHAERAVSLWDHGAPTYDFNLAGALNALAKALENSNEIRRSVEALRRLHQLLTETRGDGDKETIDALQALARVLGSVDEVVEADAYFERVLHNLTEAGGFEQDVRLLMRQLAYRQVNNGNINVAESLLRKALAVEARVLKGDDEDSARAFGEPNILIGLAWLFEIQGRNSDAEALLRQGVHQMQQIFGAKSTAQVRILTRLAEFYMDHERSSDALKVLQNTQRLLPSDDSERIDLLIYEGLAHLKAGSSEQAVRVLEKARDAASKIGDVEERETQLADVLSRLGQAYAAARKFAMARKTLSAAHTLIKKYAGEQPTQQMQLASRDVLLNLAKLSADEQNYSSASEYLAAATEITTEYYRERSAKTRYAKAWSDRRDDEVNEDILNGFATLVSQLPEKKIELDQRSFEAAQAISDTAAAKSVARAALRARVSPELAGMVRRLQDLRARRDAVSDQLAGVRAGNGIGGSHEHSEKLHETLVALDSELIATEKELCSFDRRYCATLRASTTSPAELSSLLGSNEALMLIVMIRHRTYIWVVSGEAVEYRVVNLSEKALLEKVAALRCGLDEEEWTGLSSAARCGTLLGIERPADADPLPFHLGIAHELYQALFGAVENLIQGKQLLIVSSGPLTSLPFHVLVTRTPEAALPNSFAGYRGVPWLGRAHAISVLPSVSSLKALRRHAKGSSGPKAYIGYGNPLLDGDGSCREVEAPGKCPAIEVVTSANIEAAGQGGRRALVRGGSGRRSPDLTTMFDKGEAADTVLASVRALCPLPDTAYEVRCVAERLGIGSEIRLDASATEADVKDLSEKGTLANYRVVHFATHGLLAGDVEVMAKRQGEPALVLTPPKEPKDKNDDGLLMASEVASLKLNADWVVLSACNTASADKPGAEALSGLAKAFFYAGARSLIVSHWPVYSDAAVRLTTHAFAAIDAGKVKGRAEALQQAMGALMDDPTENDNAHPAVWAPFILVGEGGG